MTSNSEQPQADKFKDAATELETDDDEAGFSEHRKGLVKKRTNPSRDAREARLSEKAEGRRAAESVEEDAQDERIRKSIKDHGA